ncbi:MAG: hypothetical protein HFE76_03875 [Firmicutes bacterium]|nr:hypothetical protein [Bacillota bacterium]
MKRKCVLMILALVVIFGSVSVASAYAGAGNIHVSRTSNTSASVSADISYTKVLTSCTNTITLQEKYNGSWRTATGVPVKTVTKTKHNTRTLALPYTFTLVKGKVYRVKAVFTSQDGSTSKVITCHSGTF